MWRLARMDAPSKRAMLASRSPTASGHHVRHSCTAVQWLESGLLITGSPLGSWPLQEVASSSLSTQPKKGICRNSCPCPVSGSIIHPGPTPRTCMCLSALTRKCQKNTHQARCRRSRLTALHTALFAAAEPAGVPPLFLCSRVSATGASHPTDRVWSRGKKKKRNAFLLTAETFPGRKSKPPAAAKHPSKPAPRTPTEAEKAHWLPAVNVWN